jgi:hypothetical protein
MNKTMNKRLPPAPVSIRYIGGLTPAHGVCVDYSPGIVLELRTAARFESHMAAKMKRGI